MFNTSFITRSVAPAPFTYSSLITPSGQKKLQRNAEHPDQLIKAISAGKDPSVIREMAANSGYRIDNEAKNGRTALGHAIMTADSRYVSALLGDPNAPRDAGRANPERINLGHSPLTMAAMQNRPMAVSPLVGAGANINRLVETDAIPGMTHANALAVSLYFKNPRVTQQLIKCGADYNKICCITKSVPPHKSGPIDMTATQFINHMERQSPTYRNVATQTTPGRFSQLFNRFR
jgi:hypothetical protein